MAITGTCELAASIIAVSEFSAPGPVDRSSGAGARAAGVAVGGEPGTELGAVAVDLDRAGPQRLPDGQRVDPRDPEGDLGAERAQALGDEVAADSRRGRSVAP